MASPNATVYPAMPRRRASIAYASPSPSIACAAFAYRAAIRKRSRAACWAGVGLCPEKSGYLHSNVFPPNCLTTTCFPIAPRAPRKRMLS